MDTVKKRVFYTELAYVLGLLALAVGTALMERADFGVSMVVAPAYLLHLKLSEFWPFFTFGMAEYTFQAVLVLVTMLLLRRAKLSYFFLLCHGGCLRSAAGRCHRFGGPFACERHRGGSGSVRGGYVVLLRGRVHGISYLHIPRGVRAFCEGAFSEVRGQYP